MKSYFIYYSKVNSYGVWEQFCQRKIPTMHINHAYILHIFGYIDCVNMSRQIQHQQWPLAIYFGSSIHKWPSLLNGSA